MIIETTEQSILIKDLKNLFQIFWWELARNSLCNMCGSQEDMDMLNLTSCPKLPAVFIWKWLLDCLVVKSWWINRQLFIFVLKYLVFSNMKSQRKQSTNVSIKCADSCRLRLLNLPHFDLPHFEKLKQFGQWPFEHSVFPWYLETSRFLLISFSVSFW